MSIKRLVEDEVRRQFRLYGYEEVETPTLEYFELFEKKSGKEIRERMYVFPDRHGRRLALRPEVTPSIARIVATRLKAAPMPIRLGYIGDCYRYDEPQWGRRRRFWQAGFEIIGSSAAESDAEVLLVSEDLFEGLGLLSQRFVVGHVGILRAVMSESGVGETDQDRVLGSIDRGDQETAFDILKQAGMATSTQETIRELTQRSSDDVEQMIREGYEILQPWSSAVGCLQNLETILKLARSGGMVSRVTVRLGFARGLEYYTGFVFEQYVPKISVALNGGGRYDHLVKLFGGKDLPAVGCAVGITRIQQYLAEKTEGKGLSRWGMPVVVIYRKGCGAYALRVASKLREIGAPAELAVGGKKLGQAISQYSNKG
ncbi:MAG: histidine--tRNA ligase family protein, partial [Aigarchaeota archaeon]|nr:histidine--tRNA ligase family protein [Aigarchaeota archaeon]